MLRRSRKLCGHKQITVKKKTLKYYSDLVATRFITNYKKIIIPAVQKYTLKYMIIQ